MAAPKVIKLTNLLFTLAVLLINADRGLSEVQLSFSDNISASIQVSVFPNGTTTSPCAIAVSRESRGGQLSANGASPLAIGLLQGKNASLSFSVQTYGAVPNVTNVAAPGTTPGSGQGLNVQLDPTKGLTGIQYDTTNLWAGNTTVILGGLFDLGSGLYYPLCSLNITFVVTRPSAANNNGGSFTTSSLPTLPALALPPLNLPCVDGATTYDGR